MHPVLFTIGGITIYSHGVMAVLGIIIGSIIIYYLAKRENLQVDYLFDTLIYTILFGIIGARVTYYVLYHEQFSSILKIFYLWEGGMVSYGGFILGGLALVAFLKFQKQPILKWLDLTAIGFSAGMVLGRMGNIFAGEYAGVVSKGGFNINGFVPVTLYEGILLLVIFLLLLFGHLRKFNYRAGFLFLLLVLLYNLGRFIIDFWRDEGDLFLGISTGQFVALMFLLFTIGFYLIYKFKLIKATK